MEQVGLELTWEGHSQREGTPGKRTVNKGIESA